ncbi:MAG: hypothetical protein K6B43_00355 [Treponema sp.]|nr:hypothetical protein [Treponema sp.]
MLKRLFLTTMIVSVTAFGALSCSDSSSDEEENTAKENTTTENPSVTTQDGNNASQSQDDGTGTENTENKTENQSQVEYGYSSYYGTFEGTVMNQSVTLTVSESSVDQGGNYGAYTKVLWLTDSDGKAVVAAQSDSTNTKNGDLTEENYTTASSCYIVFGTDGLATYYVPAMATMLPNGAAFYRVETLSVDATLSCYVNAMGGQEFGTPVHKGTKILKKADGTYKVLLSLGKGTGNIYGIDFDAFVDPSNSTPGYYDADGNVQDTVYTVSEDTAQANTGLDEDGNRVLVDVNYVTSMTFPISKDVSEYNLWIYINSNVMGVQFCDGSGEAGSGEPNVATKYVGKITIDWDSLN